MFGGCLFGLFDIDPPSSDHFREVVLSVVWDHVFSAWFLNVVNFNLEVVAVGNSKASRNVELLEALADVLKLSVRHLGVELIAEGRPDKEESWHDLRLLVEATSISHIAVFEVFFAQHKFE